MLAIYLLVVIAACTGSVLMTKLVALVSQNLLSCTVSASSPIGGQNMVGSAGRAAAAALATCGFLLSGFGWWLAYPAALRPLRLFPPQGCRQPRRADIREGGTDAG